MSFFAPQAYTKETLSKAFEWLQHQPASIKQAAANPEMLVSIYLQAQRQGLQKIDADAPVSSRKFIDDLKTLSKDFAQFDDAGAQPPMANAAKQSLQQNTPQQVERVERVPPHAHHQTPAVNHHVSNHQPPQSQQTVQHHPQITHTQQVTQQFTQQITQPLMNHQNGKDSFFTLDETSMALVKRVQERFNLSSPQEAVRMLVSVGSEHISRWN